MNEGLWTGQRDYGEHDDLPTSPEQSKSGGTSYACGVCPVSVQAHHLVNRRVRNPVVPLLSSRRYATVTELGIVHGQKPVNSAV
jgi:hypothetical protein